MRIQDLIDLHETLHLHDWREFNIGDSFHTWICACGKIRQNVHVFEMGELSMSPGTFSALMNALTEDEIRALHYFYKIKTH